MYKKFTHLFFLLFALCPPAIFAQKQDRIQLIQQKLEDLSITVPGLSQPVNLQLTSVSIHDYLIALSKANKLSISIDPKLTYNVSEVLNNVPASNVLSFLAKKYNLDVTIVGSIIYITPYDDPSLLKPPAKEIGVKYSQLENTLSLELNNDTLGSVVKKITRLSGKNVLVLPAITNKKVSGYFASASFDAVLEKLAYSNDIKVVRTNDNFYLFQPLDENEELYINGDKNTASRRVFSSTSVPLATTPPTTIKSATPGTTSLPTVNGPVGPLGKISLFARTVNGEKLISIDAINVPITDLIKQASQEMGKNYSVYSDIRGTITLHLNDVNYDGFLNLLFKGSDYTYRYENGIYLMGDSKLEGLRTYKVIQLQNRSIDTIVSMIPADWKKGVEVKEFREQNTLLLSGSGARIAEIEAFVKQLDILVPVVLIEVTLIDINKTRTVSTGISAGVADSTVKTGGTLLPGVNFTFSASSINSFLNSISGSVNLGHVVPNFYVTLQALESHNNVDVRSVPKLTALNGHSATLSIGNSVFYKNTTQNVIPSAATSQTVLSNTYTETDANLMISIKPMVSGDDQVTLAIKVDISDFTSLPTDGSPPPKATSKFESSIRVNNEDMIVLGGIERNERDDSASGVPLLSRIPILKWIFSSKTNTATRVVTLVFIKPTILR